MYTHIKTEMMIFRISVPDGLKDTFALHLYINDIQHVEMYWAHYIQIMTPSWIVSKQSRPVP